MSAKKTRKRSPRASAKPDVFGSLVKNTVLDQERLKPLLDESQAKAATEQMAKLRKHVSRGVHVFAPLTPVEHLNLFQVHLLEKLRELKQAGIRYTVVLRDIGTDSKDDALIRHALEERKVIDPGRDSATDCISAYKTFREMQETEEFQRILGLQGIGFLRGSFERLCEIFTVCHAASKRGGFILVGDTERAVYEALIHLVNRNRAFRLYLPAFAYEGQIPTISDEPDRIASKVRGALVSSSDARLLCLALRLLLIDRDTAGSAVESSVTQGLAHDRESEFNAIAAGVSRVMQRYSFGFGQGYATTK